MDRTEWLRSLKTGDKVKLIRETYMDELTDVLDVTCKNGFIYVETQGRKDFHFGFWSGKVGTIRISMRIEPL